MVSRLGAYYLMKLIADLTYIAERCRSTCDFSTPQYVQVKGDGFILDVLQGCASIMEPLYFQYESLEPIIGSMKRWIDVLDHTYATEHTFWGKPPWNLTINDARILKKDVNSWIATIIDQYNHLGTIFITQESIGELFPDSLLSGFDSLTKEDLEDALRCIIHLIPTPAAMISLRATENIVRILYEKITGLPPKKKSWGVLIDELRTHKGVPAPLLDYLNYLRVIRNEAGHPDKRFTQEESERILLQVKGLLEESTKL